MTKILPRRYDLKSLKLSAEEGFVLSRVDAPTSLEQLAAICGMEHAKLVAILETLASQGAVEIEGRAPAPVQAPAPPASPPPLTPSRSMRPMPPLVAPRSMPPRRSSVGPAPAAPPASRPPAAPSRPPAAPSRPPSEPDDVDITRPKMAAPAPVFGPIDELEDVAEDDSDDDELDGPTLARGKSEPQPEREDETDGPTVARVALAVSGICDVGKSRSNNEDAMAVIDFTGMGLVDVLGKRRSVDVGPRGILLAVSDGMGGENAGEVASALVLETLNDRLAANELDGDPAGVLAAAVQEANARVMAAAEKRELAGMGATLVAVLVAGTSAFTAEVGDSRAYVLRGGKLTQLSKDQTHVRLLVEQGLMTLEDVKKSRAKNIVLQACGKQPDLVVAQRELPLRKLDRILLCSDGLTLHVEDDEIEQVLTSVASPDEASARLVAMANERGGKDNVTVLVADVAGAVRIAGPGETAERSLGVIREFAPGEPA